jgi:hypothetical protein
MSDSASASAPARKFDRTKSKATEESIVDFLQGTWTAPLTSVPGIGAKTIKQLKKSHILCLYQLAGLCLTLKTPGITEDAWCEKIWAYFASVGSPPAHLHTVIASLLEKLSLSFPGIYTPFDEEGAILDSIPEGGAWTRVGGPVVDFDFALERAGECVDTSTSLEESTAAIVKDLGTRKSKELVGVLCSCECCAGHDRDLPRVPIPGPHGRSTLHVETTMRKHVMSQAEFATLNMHETNAESPIYYTCECECRHVARAIWKSLGEKDLSAEGYGPLSEDET